LGILYVELVIHQKDVTVSSVTSICESIGTRCSVSVLELGGIPIGYTSVDEGVSKCSQSIVGKSLGPLTVNC
jgi:hypothetical protein